MKIPLPLIYLLFTLVLFSKCSSDPKNGKTVSDFEEKSQKLVLPDSLIVYKPFKVNSSDSNKIENSGLKIYSFINVSCPSCLSNIKNFNNVASELKEYRVPVILICQSEDNYELLKYLCEKKDISEFPFPFYFDTKDQFFVRNKFLSPAPNNHTVLTDKNNKILVYGDLTLSDKIKKLYIDSIKAHKI